MDNTKLAGCVGLARRAGKCVIGHEAVRRALLEEKAKLVLMAPPKSRMLEKLAALCRQKKVCCKVAEGLGQIVGNPTCKAVAICDQGFGEAIMQLYQSTENEGYTE